MEHYKEVDFRNQHYKIGDKVWTLDGGKRRLQYLIDIFDDKYSDDSDYITKCCYTSNERYGMSKSFNHLEEVYHDEWDAKRAESRWKDNYDSYVTGGFYG